MISALEALALPSAALSASDKEAAEKIIAQIDEHIRANMTRGGTVIHMDPDSFNGIIMEEVRRSYELAGWVCVSELISAPSALNPREQVLTGVRIALRPKTEIYQNFDQSK